MILDDIIANKRQEITILKAGQDLQAVLKIIEKLPPTRKFAQVFQKEKIALIAEVKRASPSAGVISQDFDPIGLAKTYEKSGAAAISVLTDKKYFQGDISYLSAVKAATTIPVLRKDFIIDPAQIYEARLAGADAILLIVRILSDDPLKGFLSLAQGLGMNCLVEAHDAREVERALTAGAEIIGINNRDLESLEVDLNITLKMMAKFQELKKKVVVSESGISSAEQVRALKEKGVSGILVGESLLRASDIGAKVRELIG